MMVIDHDDRMVVIMMIFLFHLSWCFACAVARCCWQSRAWTEILWNLHNPKSIIITIKVIIIIMVNSSRLSPDSFFLRRLLSPPFPPVLIILLLYNLKLLQCIYLFFLFSFSGKSHWFDRPDINTPGHQCMGNIPSENRLIENGLSENRPSKNEWMLFIMKWSKSFSMPPRIC